MYRAKVVLITQLIFSLFWMFLSWNQLVMGSAISIMNDTGVAADGHSDSDKIS